MHRDLNPYAPPEANIDFGATPDFGGPMLADRGTRFGARMLDGLLMIVATVPPLGVAAVVDKPAFMLFSGVFFLGLMIYQWYLVATTGQTLGKRWLGIRVVKMTGAPVDFAAGVVAREWLPSLLGMVPLFGLVDILFIFRDDRRCIHDLLAGTKVIAI